MKKLTATFLFCVFFLFAKADTFVVTSNADSGPGTLREAITLANANGTAVADVINFNLPDLSIAGRTITLKTSLPDLLGNITIDGSTQPGAKIGVSDAKIRITSIESGLENAFRIIGQKDISFFALHFDNIKSPSTGVSGGRAIAIINTEHILIGSPGKGNYFTNLSVAVSEPTTGVYNGNGINQGLVFKSNIFNLSEDGNSIVSHGPAFTLVNVRDLEIGGELESEGNYMCTASDYIAWTYTDTFAHVNLGTYKIINNKLGCNYTQTDALKCGAIYLRNGSSYGYNDVTRIIIKNNSYNSGLITGSNWLQGFIELDNKKGFIDIKGNKIGLLTGNQNFYFANISTAIIIRNCEDGIIGGDNPLDTNYIAGCIKNGIGLGGNRAIRITKNSLFCNSNGILVNSSQLAIPKTKIFTITDHLVEGTTLPDSRVEVFLTTTCAGCKNGKTYLGSTVADAVGNWSFTSPVLLDGAVTATGTSPQQVTGEFAKPEYEFNDFETKDPTCNKNNGFIKGLKFVAGTRYYWLHTVSGVSDTLFTEDVLNAGPGYYKFVVEQGKYCSDDYALSLGDNSPRINAQFQTAVQPSCGLANGKILQHYLSGSYNKVMWKDAAGRVVGSNTDLINVAAGQYKLVILDTINGCGDSTQYYTLVNQSGPSLDLNSVLLTSATCSKNNGSITGLTATNVTGTPYLQWVDSLNKTVGTAYNLQNVPPGKYRFRFKDAGGCDTIITSFYTVGNTGAITIDTTGTLITPANCAGSTGSIQHVGITGGETYEWKNTNSGAVVGTAPDVFQLTAGGYRLTVSNQFGCSQTSPVINVPQASFLPIVVLETKAVAATCGKPNADVEVVRFSGDTSLYTFRWADSTSGQTVSRFTHLYSVPNGTYLLYAKDGNGCEQEILKAILFDAPVPSFDDAQLNVTPDQCLTGSGAIQGLAVKNLYPGTTTYAWVNSSGDTIGHSLNLANLPQDSYRLVVSNAGCLFVSQPVVVDNTNVLLSGPQYDDVIILKNTAATLSVKNKQPGTYFLYDLSAATAPVQQNTTGIFTTPVLTADKTFYIRYISGVCQSEVVAVQVKVVDKNAVYVPSAFSPNGDGKNDLLKALPVGMVKLVSFTVYNRWGQPVFSTTNFSKGWNGTINGHPVETGVYVWVLKAMDEISGNKIEQKGTVTVIR